MKIGIVTQPLYDNYGAILQNWALQQTLIGMGHHPITIDYLPRQSFVRHILSYVKMLLLFFKSKRIITPIREHKRNRDFERFVNDNIVTTRTVHSYNESIIREYGIGLLIIGSDQVWRPKYNGPVLYDMYGRFAQNIPVVAYAASFGVDKWEYDKKQSKICKALAQNIRAVSVREQSAVALCKKYLDVSVEHVLDPTLLQDRNNYKKICECVAENSEEYVLAYILDDNDDINKVLDDITEEKKCKILRYSLNNRNNLSVEQWLSRFRDAKYVVTDSYHGTVFSIIFNKPFMVLANSKRGRARFESLLYMADLKKQSSNVWRFDDVDWEKVNERLQDNKNHSMQFLQSAGL